MKQHGFRTYVFEKRMSDGIMVLMWMKFKHKRNRLQRDIWTLVKLRGYDRKCVITGKTIERGAQAWSPVTFGDNRGERISAAGMEALEKEAKEFR